MDNFEKEIKRRMDNLSALGIEIEQAKVPEKIYVHEASVNELAEPHNDYHLEYISKDALLNWINENRKSLMLSPINEQTGRKILAYDLLERKLNEM